MIERAFKIICLGIFVLVLGLPALAQNTKGDRPSPPTRETRFKTPKKSGHKRKPGRRVKEKADRSGQRAALRPGRTRRSERAGRPIRPTFEKSRPSDKQKAWKGDITGRRIRPRSSASRARNIYPQPGTTNYSSRTLRRNAHSNKNPNVRRVRRIMQHHERAKARPGRPIRPVYINKRPRHRERAWRGDITGRRIQTRVSGRRAIPGGRGVGQPSGQAGPKVQAPAPINGRDHQGARNYNRRKFYVNNQSQRPPGYRGPSKRAALLMRGNPPRGSAQVKGRRIVPRSASAAYLTRKSINVWAHFQRPRRRQERAVTKDLAGKKLRTKNFETPRPVLTNPTLNYQKRIAGGERPYKGAAGGYASRRPGQKPWRGDIAHWPLRAGKAPSGRGRAGKAVPGKAPRIGAPGIGKYQGNIKARQRRGFGQQGEEYSGNIRTHRLLKGGGSVSGRVWNNNGLPIQGKTPGKGSSGIGYQGNIKARRRALNNQGEGYSGNIKLNRKRGFTDQGEEYSGNVKIHRGFSNQGEEYRGNIRLDRKRGFRDQGEEYAGNIRRRRGFNDQGEEYRGNIRRAKKAFNDQGEEYTGNIKVRHRLNDQGEEYSGNIKARHRYNDQGEEYSGNIKARHRYNDQGEEYSGNIKVRRGFNDQGEEYTGNIKARRPPKGGGSVSGKVWNNNNSPIVGHAPRGQGQIARYQGNMKVRGRQLQDQGEEYTGNIKARRPAKGGGSVSGKLWNNHETPIAARVPKSDQGARFAGNMRISKNSYKRNPNSSEDALRVQKDDSQGANFQGNMKLARNRYRRNPNSPPSALPVLKPSDATARANRYSGGVRRNWDYVRNPSAADAALRTREPGRAFARATDYQGSIKLKRFDLFGKSDLHPDAKFVKLNKNNVPEEKDMITNFKLWWARLFRKNDTQPDHLKEKERKPRYDKGEAGMWYE